MITMVTNQRETGPGPQHLLALHKTFFSYSEKPMTNNKKL